MYKIDRHRRLLCRGLGAEVSGRAICNIRPALLLLSLGQREIPDTMGSIANLTQNLRLEMDESSGTGIAGDHAWIMSDRHHEGMSYV